MDERILDRMRIHTYLLALVVGLAGAVAFLAFMVGPDAGDADPLWLVDASAVIGFGVAGALAASVAAVAWGRRRLIAVLPVMVAVLVLVVPAFTVFQSGSYAPATPSGPAADCLAWRHPIAPEVGRWSAGTVLCVAAGLPILDGDAVAAVARIDLTYGLSTGLYALSTAICGALLGGALTVSYRRLNALDATGSTENRQRDSGPP
jgi:hypothetical protein